MPQPRGVIQYDSMETEPSGASSALSVNSHPSADGQTIDCVIETFMTEVSEMIVL